MKVENMSECKNTKMQWDCHRFHCKDCGKDEEDI